MTIRTFTTLAFVSIVAATSAAANDGVDRICDPHDLPSATQPHVEMSRADFSAKLAAVFAPADGVESADDVRMGAMEVVVARIGANGKVELSCVDDEAAARAFFAAPLARVKNAAEEK